MEKRKNKISRKKLAVAIALAIILGGSSFAVVSSLNPSSSPVAITPAGQNNMTELVSEVFKNIPLQCYIVYTNPAIKNDTSLTVRIYNQTKNDLVDLFKDKTYSFLNEPATKIYLFNKCGFFDNRNVQIPNKYDPKLAVWNQTSKNQQFEEMRLEIQAKYDFKKTALNENSIINLSNFYLLTYPQVVAKLIQNDLFSVDKNCFQLPKAHKGILECEWGISRFVLSNSTGEILVYPDVTPDQNTNQNPNQKA